MWKAKLPDSKIFLCYRRDDSQGHAGRLYDSLRNRCDANRLFRDVDTIHPGENFPQLIEDTIVSCRFFIVIIGRSWLHSTNNSGRRLENSQDFVRKEISTALKNSKTVIPVLVQGALMPEEHDLPDELKPMASINALEISDTRWAYDMERLFAALSLSAPRIPGAINWNFYKKLLAVTILSISVLLLFFRRDIVQRLLFTDTLPPVEELFFPSFLLIIGVFILNYKIK